MKKWFVWPVLLAGVLCACGAQPTGQSAVTLPMNTERPVVADLPADEAGPTPEPTPAAETTLTAADLTLEEKVGQLFIIRPDSLDLTLPQEQIDDAKADGVTELTDAMRAIAGEVKAGTLQPEDINEKTIESHLYRDLPQVDLMIRTSGEERLSNFLLWQCAYSEFYFTPVLFPDFTKECFDKALEEYARRDRRMGGNTKK